LSLRLPHRDVLRVHSFDVDTRGRLRPRALCAFLQEAAGHDADRRGVGMARLRGEGLAWVLLRLRAEVTQWPAEQQEVAVATWPTRFGGAAAERAFAAEDASGRTWARAASLWAVIDLRARRAVRLPAFVRELEVVDQVAGVSLEPAASAPAGSSVIGERRIEVRRGDLDGLGHVNNVYYLEWGLEGVPDEWLEEHEMASFDVAFRREARLGDAVLSRTRLGDHDQLVHELVAAMPGAEVLATLETRWRQGQADGTPS
jgi:acyl-CoA thioesterase FadM